MKIITIVGARPQFVKAAVVSRAIDKINQENRRQTINEVIIHTGQHYDTNMSDIFFEEMQISKPNYHLGIGGASHGAMTGRMLEKIEEVLLIEKPDLVIIYGDTNSTLAGALAAAKLHIPVAHVEGGLRNYDRTIPEEINRVLTDHLSTWIFCPSQLSVDNLAREGFLQEKREKAKVYVHNVGDVMYDAFCFYLEKATPTPNTKNLIHRVGGGYCLTTIHRAGNTDDAIILENIIKGFKLISAHIPVIIPLHPRTQRVIKQNNINIDGLDIIEPVGYFDMLFLLKHSGIVITDSGGVQKEAYFAKKPCITLIDYTPWLELVQCGVNTTIDSDTDLIYKTAINKLQDTDTLVFPPNIYGDANAGEKIVDILTRVCV
jgi:UDP-GlcNAc3NAcA epimerase